MISKAGNRDLDIQEEDGSEMLGKGYCGFCSALLYVSRFLELVTSVIKMGWEGRMDVLKLSISQARLISEIEHGEWERCFREEEWVKMIGTGSGSLWSGPTLCIWFA